jgi:trans-aconitate 2-methyltransferase
MALDSWNPAQYAKFAGVRLRPALDLLARIDLEAPATVYDLGCGPGRITQLLAERWPRAEVVGLDASPAMLAVARRDFPALRFVEADLVAWTPAPPAHLLFSNAALHWLDDHARLLPRLLRQVRPGGQFAVQMPRNHDQPSHQAILAAAAAGPWRDRLAPLLRPSPVAPAERYYALLAPLARRLDIWETTYLQVLEGDNPVVEFTKGSALKPLLDALDSDMRFGFEAAYRGLIAAAYPAEADGRTLFPFRRLFILAERGEGGDHAGARGDKIAAAE